MTASEDFLTMVTAIDKSATAEFETNLLRVLRRQLPSKSLVALVRVMGDIRDPHHLWHLEFRRSRDAGGRDRYVHSIDDGLQMLHRSMSVVGYMLVPIKKTRIIPHTIALLKITLSKITFPLHREHHEPIPQAQKDIPTIHQFAAKCGHPVQRPLDAITRM